MDIQKLQQLHDAVKNHVYRSSGGCVGEKGYFKLLRELSNESYNVLSKYCKDNGFSLGGNFHHDFNTVIFHLRKEIGEKSENICHVERCIGTIHKFLDTGEFVEFYSYNTGGTIFEYCKDNPEYRVRHWVFSPKKKVFEWKYDEVLFKGIVKELEEYKEKNGEFHEWYLWTQESYDYLTGRLKKGK